MTGLVLAGGASRRMGRDKATLAIDGQPLVVRVAARLEAVCDTVLVASGDGARLDGLGYRQVVDVVPDAGPLAGIVAGLEAATTPLVAVAAVDLPFVDPAVLVALADAWSGEVAVVPSVDGRVHPLHAVYATAAAPRLRADLDQGRWGVTAVLRDAGARVVEESVWRRIDPTGRFATNLNRPEDLWVVDGDTTGRPAQPPM